MTRAELKETLRNIMNEESEYQVFFKNALEKAGKSITDMSDEEKKEFFNKIDAAWDGKGEKNEELVGNQKKLDVDGDGEIEASDLAALRAGIKEVELPKAMIPGPIKAKLTMAIDKIKDTNLSYPQKLQVIGKIIDSLGIDKKELTKISTRIKGTLESVNEGKKRFNTNYGVGKSKYVVNYHDGVKKHKDGSDFFDVQIFKNQKDLEAFKKALLQKGFVAESVNEAAGKEAMGIAAFTGTRGDAVQKFIDDNKLDAKKLFNYVKGGKLTDRLNFVTAIVGTPGNSVQKRMIKMFGESNELVDEISFGQGIKDLRTGKTSSVEGVKVSRTLANAIQSWVMSSPWGQRYGKQMMKAPFAAAWKMILSDSFGVEKYLSRWDKETLAKVKPEIAKIKSKLTSESLTEGRAFINAAKKAKSEGKTEFEFNGKTYPVTIKESKLMIESQINEDANMNKKVKALLDKELRDLRKGGSNHYFAVMHILMGALTDANFHSESKKVPAIFGSKAKYEGDPQGKNDLIDMYEYEIGTDIAHICKWDGKDIVNAVGFYVSMTIGRPMGEKIEKLV